MAKILEITGQKFNRLTVVSFHSIIKNNSHWNCLCDCGTKKIIIGKLIKRGHIKSCGCLRDEHTTKTHGMSNTPLYKIWKNIKQRCYNGNNPRYKDYGGRGIKMHPSWFNDFPQFVKDIGDRPSLKHSIERIDNNGNYSPKNCYWATNKIQGQNKRTNKVLTYKGESKPLIYWSEKFNTPYNRLKARLKRGWTIKKAIETPVILPAKKHLYNGQEKILKDWAKVSCVPLNTIRDRINKGWSIERAIETPLRKRKKK